MKKFDLEHTEKREKPVKESLDDTTKFNKQNTIITGALGAIFSFASLFGGMTAFILVLIVSLAAFVLSLQSYTNALKNEEKILSDNNKEKANTEQEIDKLKTEIETDTKSIIEKHKKVKDKKETDETQDKTDTAKPAETKDKTTKSEAA